MLKAYKIAGDSMAPTLRDGDIVLSIKTKPAALRSGLIYVIDHIDFGMIIKRLGELTSGSASGDRYHLIGDNPASTPSALMGTVEPARVKRRAVLCIGSNGVKRL